MTLRKQSPIALSQIAPFLPHPGSRLGYFDDPPSSSVAIEGGTYQGDEYAGQVFTLTSPSAGEVRVDLVMANPLADGGPTIELVEGTEGETTGPDVSAYPGAAAIAEITVIGNENGRVVVLRSDINDLRPILVRPASQYQMLFHGRLILGKNMPAVGSQELMGQDVLDILEDDELSEIYPFPKILTVRKTLLRTQLSNPEDTTRTYMDLEMPYYVDDFHLVVTPYDTHFRVGSSAAVGGVSVKRLTSINVDALGRPLPLVRVTAVASGVNVPGQRFSDNKVNRRGSAFFDFQAWGKIS